MARSATPLRPTPVVTETSRRASNGAPKPHPSRTERAARGKAARADVPLAQHALVPPADARADPLALLERQAITRVAELVPIRYGRMLASPFAHYRGAALAMAADLGVMASSGLKVQLCGDAHLLNFGVFASPERHLVFDLNDFDETLPGPFEWDVKRLVTSFEVAGRENGYKRKKRREIVLTAARGYREAMREFAALSNLGVWYAHLDLERDLAGILPLLKPSRARLTEQELAKARTRDSLQAVAKLTTQVDGQRRVISDPPLIVPLTELMPDHDRDDLISGLRTLVRAYRRTLQSDRKHLLEQFHIVDAARKVVGVGSVGTRDWIILLEGVDPTDPLVLQAKEAQPSVLEEYVGAGGYSSQGARVVAGQRLMQASSDIFLGWQRTSGVDGVDRDYYVRQLRDWKGAITPERMIPSGMAVYARICGWTLARAHARSGDRVAIASYLGGRDTFDNAVADFAAAYADLNERDYAALEAAAGSGRVDARTGV